MEWRDRIRAAFAHTASAPDDDVIEELAQHAQTTHEAALAAGAAREDADARVADLIERWRRDPDSLRHRSHRGSRAPAIEPPPNGPPRTTSVPAARTDASSRFAGLMQDVRYAMRLLRRQPRQALLTVVTLALGIGATTALFSVTFGVLMKPLAWPTAERIVVLKETRGGNLPRFGAFTNTAFLAWREEATTVERLAAWTTRAVTLTGAGDPEPMRVTAANASLFAVLGARPLIGTFFDTSDEQSPVVVIAERLWRERFGASPSVLGQAIRLDDEPYTIVGVLPDALAFPDRQARAIVPYAVPPVNGNALSLFSAVAALRPGATAAQASAEGTARGRQAKDTGLTTMAIFGNNGPIAIEAQPLAESLTADVRRPLIILLIAVGLLLVTATANVASLQLARTTTRHREMALRVALGADHARVMRQLLVESLSLGIGGGAAGLALAALLHRALPALLPANFPRADDVHVDAVVLTFALLVSVGTSIVCGVLPAFRVRRLNLVEALTVDGTTAPVGAGTRSRIARSRMVIMTGQVAIACILLVGASLLGRSFLALLNADRGYDPSDVLSARLTMPAKMFPAPQRRFAIVDQVLSRLADVPGVAEAAFTSEIPLTAGGSTSAFTLRSPTGEVTKVQASPRIVSTRYFAALRIRTVAGRVFAATDTAASEPVVVVNQAFARRYLGDAPLGAKVPMTAYGPPNGPPIEATVVGVVQDARYITTISSSQPEVYFLDRQMDGGLPVYTITLLLRTSSDPVLAAPAVRVAVREADPRLVADVTPLDQRLLTTLARPRLYAMLLGGFAAFALIIAAVGLFGLLSYSVSLRSRELAVRAALGAKRLDIVRLVLGQGLGVTVAGLAIGLIAAASLTRLLSTQLYGVTPYDTLTFIVVPLLLLIVAVVACLIPARRAATLDPLQVFRRG